MDAVDGRREISKVSGLRQLPGGHQRLYQRKELYCAPSASTPVKIFLAQQILLIPASNFFPTTADQTSEKIAMVRGINLSRG